MQHISTAFLRPSLRLSPKFKPHTLPTDPQSRIKRAISPIMPMLYKDATSFRVKVSDLPIHTDYPFNIQTGCGLCSEISVVIAFRLAKMGIFTSIHRNKNLRSFTGTGGAHTYLSLWHQGQQLIIDGTWKQFMFAHNDRCNEALGKYPLLLIGSRDEVHKTELEIRRLFSDINHEFNYTDPKARYQITNILNPTAPSIDLRDFKAPGSTLLHPDVLPAIHRHLNHSKFDRLFGWRRLLGNQSDYID